MDAHELELSDRSKAGSRVAKFFAALPLCPIRQHCFVSADPIAAAQNIGQLYGIKSWYRPHFEGQISHYKNQELKQSIDLIIGQAGYLQIEIVKAQTDEPSVFNVGEAQDKLLFHHIGIAVRKRARALDALMDAGIEPIQVTDLFLSERHRAKILCAYFDFGTELNFKIELIETRIHGFNSGLKVWPQNIARGLYRNKLFEKVRL